MHVDIGAQELANMSVFFPRVFSNNLSTIVVLVSVNEGII